MKPIDVGKIKVLPFEIERILEIKIEKEINEHSTLYVYGVVKDDKQITPVTDTKEGTSIKCENDGQIYFNGILQKVKITRIDAVYYLEIHAISNTILLDIEKHKRSFQNNEETYKTIVETIISKKEGVVKYNAPEKTVENIILQYDETDWEFAKRLASHTQDVLIPIIDDKPVFYFGVPDEGQGILDKNDFSITRDYKIYRQMATEAEPLTEQEVTIYTVQTDELIGSIGEKFILNGMDLHIIQITITLVGAALTVTYTLCEKKGISTPKKYNQAIIGLVLDGTVLKIENDTVRLHLAIDKEQDREQEIGTAHPFKYATGYSAEGNTGWYVMPEEGDIVQLLFPKEDEKYAYAASSIRQEDTERTVDSLIKYWRTTFGKEIKMDQKEILITSRDDETFIRINEETGIEIRTPQPIQVQSGSTLSITSAGDMSIATERNLQIQAGETIRMTCGENTMSFIPASGIAVSTDRNLELSSENDTTIDSKQEVALKSGNDTKLEIGKSLTGTAGTKIELDSSGSSVVLQNQGVDIKGRKINEN